MIKTIYIAENNINDMFETGEQEYSTEIEELPPLPEDAAQSSELAFIANKSLVSFGTMAVCVIVIIVIAFMLKNKKQTKDASAHEIFTDEDPDLVNNDSSEYITSQPSRKINTLGGIHNCIVSFLEKTKDI